LNGTISSKSAPVNSPPALASVSGYRSVYQAIALQCRKPSFSVGTFTVMTAFM
jgi:hypothetical protein